MLIKIRYPNHHHSYDFLCFNSMSLRSTVYPMFEIIFKLQTWLVFLAANVDAYLEGYLCLCCFSDQRPVFYTLVVQTAQFYFQQIC